PRFTAAYFDETGLYAFGRQPDALAWNLTRLAECFVSLSSIDALEPELNRFWPAIQRHLATAVAGRLGVAPRGAAEDGRLLSAFFAFMETERPAYEQVFFDWRGGIESAARAEAGPQAALYRSESFAQVKSLLETCEAAPDANLAHPYFAGEKSLTMLIGDVEAIWAPIADDDDWAGFAARLAAIEDMARAYGRENFTI